MPGKYSTVVPSLRGSNIVWPNPYQTNIPTLPQGIPVQTTLAIEYNVQIEVVSTAIIEWNIGIPVSNQIRQTSADRTDFAY